MESIDIIGQVENNFKHHNMDKTDINTCKMLRSKYKNMAESLVVHCPINSRELAIALTKLEESMFWANAAIARWK